MWNVGAYLGLGTCLVHYAIDVCVCVCVCVNGRLQWELGVCVFKGGWAVGLMFKILTELHKELTQTLPNACTQLCNGQEKFSYKD